MPRRIHTLIILSLLAGVAAAQQPADSLSNLRIRKILPSPEATLLDSLALIPGSVQVSSLSEGDYTVDYTPGTIRFSRSYPDSVTVTYRVFPFKPSGYVERFNYDSIRYNFTAEKPFYWQDDRSGDRLVDFGDMNYNGSFGRGISFGNNQDAVISSTLNLQINGLIGDSLEFTAAISDNNIPVQPDGNTQNIQDFERIFMQVKKHGWQINFGDVDIRQTGSRYLSFFKRLQGVSFLTENRFRNGNKNSAIASGAVSKGKFARNVITPQEGNQGPYKLYGGNNEIYFAILAGTERIYIDGELMQRGEDRDYVIDYNLAELTFTAKRLITKDSRIQAEFEYSDRNFLNSMLYAKNDFSIKDKWEFSIGAYSNTDAKNSPINQTLSSQQKYFLSAIGNNVDDALYPSAVADTFSANRILYKKVDTTVNGITDSIFVYSVDREVQLYNLAFTNMGAGKGNYIPSGDNANGRVFEWIAPEEGKPQGDWEPVIFLVTPKKHQIFSGSAQHTFGERTGVKVSAAVSDYDVNTFSAIGNDDNRGTAVRVDFDNRLPQGKVQDKKYNVDTHLDYEFVDHQFKSIETLRSVEFYRDWGLEIINPPADEHLLNFIIGIKDKKNNSLRYRFSNYRRNGDYSGIQNEIESIYENNGWRFGNNFFITNAGSSTFKGNFVRPAFSLSKRFMSFSNYQIGASYSAENNKQLIRNFDTLSPVSFAYNQWQFFLKSDQAKLSKWGINYFSRENYIPAGKKLNPADRSDNISVNAELMANEARQLRVNATYRILHNANADDKNNKNDRSLLGRADYSFNEWDGVLNGTVFYELGAGQEQKREYTYVEVPAGQGLYQWVDYNDDGIPQLNEFEIAVFQDQKRWVRILTPTNEYIKANYVQFNYNLSINPQKIRKETSGLKFVKRLNTTSALQINKKEISHGDFTFNPFGKQFDDTSLISVSSFLSNSLYYNRANPVWGMDITHRVNTNKAILSYGFESSRLRDLGWRLRINTSKTINTSLRTNFRKRILSVPSFEDRNYNIREFDAEPSLSYVYKTEFRASVLYGYDHKKNTGGVGESAINNSFTAEVRYNVFASGVINARLTFNSIQFEGNVNSPAGFILLDGLLPGKNLLWNIELSKRIAGNIEMNLQYEGRKPAETHVIHTGRASLRAIF